MHYVVIGFVTADTVGVHDKFPLGTIKPILILSYIIIIQFIMKEERQEHNANEANQVKRQPFFKTHAPLTVKELSEVWGTLTLAQRAQSIVSAHLL